MANLTDHTEGTLEKQPAKNDPFTFHSFRTIQQTYINLDKVEATISETTTGISEVVVSNDFMKTNAFLEDQAFFHFGINGKENLFSKIGQAATGDFTVKVELKFYEDATNNTFIETENFDFNRNTFQLITDLPPSPLFAYNNQNIKFTYDKNQTSFDADRAEVEILGERINILPSPTGEYEAFLKSYLSRLINPDYFEDGLTCEVDTVSSLPIDTILDPNEFEDITIDVTLFDGTNETSFSPITRRFLKAVGQLSQFIKGKFNEGKDYFFLNGNHHTFFKGYPCSIGLYSKDAQNDVQVIDAKCKYSIDIPSGASRLMLGQGDKDLTDGAGIQEQITFPLNPTFNRSAIRVTGLDGTASFDFDNKTKQLSNGDSYFDKSGNTIEENTSGSQTATLTYDDAFLFEFVDYQKDGLSEDHIINNGNYHQYYDIGISAGQGKILDLTVSGGFRFAIEVSGTTYLLLEETITLWLSNSMLDINFLDDPQTLPPGIDINVLIYNYKQVLLHSVQTDPDRECMPLDKPQHTYNLANFGDLHLKTRDKCGVFLKWHHDEAGWSYWLFEASEEINTSQERGYIEKDYERLPYSGDAKQSKGMNTFRRLELQTFRIDKHQLKVLNSLISSPKVERFWGEKGTKDSPELWETVFIRGSEITESRSDKTLFDVKIIVELQDKHNLTL